MPPVKKQPDPAPPPEPAPESAERSLPALPRDVEDRAIQELSPQGDSTTMSAPRVILVQGSSREAKDEDNPHKLGTFVNRLTKESLGKEYEFIPLGRFSQRLYLKLGEGLVCRSTNMDGPAQMDNGLTADGQPTNDCSICVRKDWPRDRIKRGETITGDAAKKGPECSVVENFPSLHVAGDNPSDFELILNSFSRTSIQAAKDLIGIFRMSRKPWYAFKYKNVAQKTSSDGNDYYRQTVIRVGKTTEEEQKAAQDTLKFLADPKQWATDDEAMESEAAPEAATASGRTDF